jgi:2OG-Fe(II) oxygenase superfamily
MSSNNGVNIKEVGTTNIYVIDNAFDRELCDELMKYIDSTKLKKLSFTDNNNVECYSVVHIEENETHRFVIEKIKELFKSVSEINDKIKIVGQTLFELRKVYGETRIHQDGVFNGDIIQTENNGKVKTVRSLTIVLTLNDDFEGGVYTFPNQNITIKPKKGTAILFPPYYTHPHGVSAIENGKFRYICSSWALDEFMIRENDNCADCNKNPADDDENDCILEEHPEPWSYKNFFISFTPKIKS